MVVEDTDAIAVAQAQEARSEGIRIIESHLESHLVQNPGSDYVTWLATLHPENAQVVVDPRFFVPNNPWWSVYERAKAPEAVVVLDPHGVPINNNNDSPPPSDKTNDDACFCNPIGFLIGILLTFSSILVSLMLEIAALVVYSVAAVFYHISSLCGQEQQQSTNPITGIFYSIFMLVYWVLAMVDSILLIVSVLVSEILASVSGLLGFLCGGCGGAQVWHQSVRRSSHVLRSKFRKPFQKPSRSLCCGEHSECSSGDDDENNDNEVNVVVTTSLPENNPSGGITVSRIQGDQESAEPSSVAVLIGDEGGEAKPSLGAPENPF